MNRSIIVISVFLLLIGQTLALETIRAKKKDGTEREYLGRILVLGTEGEVVLQTRDGQIHPFLGEEILERKTDEREFVPLTRKEIAPLLLEEFGDGFEVHLTEHYVVVYSTSKDYAQWCGMLFEKLYDKYKGIWTRKGLELREPEFPLVAVIFSNKGTFDRYGEEESGQAFSKTMCAYYHMLTNRIVLCDLTGIETHRENENKNATVARIRDILSRPGAGHNVSALVHEAAHQIGFNDGMFQRMSSVPRWLIEGIAMLHELPDLDNPRKNVSSDLRVNQERLRQFQVLIQKGNADPFRPLLLSDDPLLQTATAIDNYGVSWAICYYLFKKRGPEFRAYIQTMAEKKSYVHDLPKTRREEFENVFGDSWEKFYKDFFKYVRTL